MSVELDKDVPLTRDRGRLARLLADVVREQTGDAIWDEVESVPDLASHVDSLADCRAHLATLSPEVTDTLLRACGLLAQLENLAEDLHHNRRRLAHKRAGSPPQAGSLERALVVLKQRGVRAADVESLL